MVCEVGTKTGTAVDTVAGAYLVGLDARRNLECPVKGVMAGVLLDTPN